MLQRDPRPRLVAFQQLKLGERLGDDRLVRHRRDGFILEQRCEHWRHCHGVERNGGGERFIFVGLGDQHFDERDVLDRWEFEHIVLDDGRRLERDRRLIDGCGHHDIDRFEQRLWHQRIEWLGNRHFWLEHQHQRLVDGR